MLRERGRKVIFASQCEKSVHKQIQTSDIAVNKIRWQKPFKQVATHGVIVYAILFH